MSSRRAPRRGFTLAEILVAMTLLLFVFGTAAEFFRRQTTTITAQSGRLDVQQTAQFALSMLDRDIRMAGTGVADMQPTIVQADGRAITFNGNLLSRDVGDPAAVYTDAEADEDVVRVLLSEEKLELPVTGFEYPDTTFVQAMGAPSGAETIMYWVEPDSSTSRTDDYIMWRQVNATAPSIVAQNVVLASGERIFDYYQADTAGKPNLISPASLPLHHTEITHGSPGDTALVALVDSIISVRVRLTLEYEDRDGTIARRNLEHTIRLMNAGLIHRAVCGEPPLGVVPLATAVIDTVDSLRRVEVTWTASDDETAGERDVNRYAVYRWLAAESPMSEPYVSIAAGQTSYTFVDVAVDVGQTWVYGVTAVDCTPNSSTRNTTAPILIP